MGHALNGSIQDALIRYKRMRGQQHAVDPRHRPRRHRDADAGREASCATEGTTREELGREAFLERVWEWQRAVRRHDHRPVQAARRVAATTVASASRSTRATSAPCSRSSCDLYDEGPDLPRPLPGQLGPRQSLGDLRPRGRGPRGHRHARTRSPTRSPTATGEIVVATVRPETMLADIAVAVHPDDERYTRAGRQARSILPLVGRELPIIADEYVKTEFGTGALKITPGPRPERLRDRPPPRARRALGDRRGRHA